MRLPLLMTMLVLAAPAMAQTPQEWRYLASRVEARAVLSEKAPLPRYNRMDGVISQPQYMTAAFHTE